MLFDALSIMPDVFDKNILLKGQEYFDQEKVLNFRFSEGLIKARVKGSSGQIYNVHLDLKRWPGQPASCSCKFNKNCKHAVASLFAIHQRFQSNKSSSSTKADSSVNNWINKLRAQQKEQKIKDATHRFVYLLQPNTKYYEHKVHVYIGLAKILKQGELGKKNRLSHLNNQKKQHLLAEDEKIINSLKERTGQDDCKDGFSIRNSQLLEDILKTGRVYLLDREDQLLKISDPIDVDRTWGLLPNGRYHFELFYNNKPVTPIFLDKAWYWDKRNSFLAPVKADESSSELQYITGKKSFSLQEAEQLEQKLSGEDNEPFVFPQYFKQKERKKVIPKSVLVFDAVRVFTHDIQQTKSKSDWYLTIEPFFDYQGAQISANDPCQEVLSTQEQTLLIYPRDITQESRKLEELSRNLAYHTPSAYELNQARSLSTHQFILDEFSDPDNLTSLYQDIIPKLKQLGWQVHLRHGIYEEILNEEEIEWFSESSENDNAFFAYQLGVLIDGKPVSIIPLVVDLISQYKNAQTLESLPDKQKVKLHLGEGKTLLISLGRIKPLIRVILQFGLRDIPKEKDSIDINRYQWY